MTDGYPVVEEKPLDPATRRGLLRLGRPRRDWNDLPYTRANHVLVYRVNGQHIVDSGRRALDDEAVVQASHVSVVDLTRDREVLVEFTIPSGDAKEFTVRVTFKCHVTDPVTVVREGQGDASRALLGYVRSHQKLFLLGLDHKISQVDEVRRLVQTQIQAYAHYLPPDVPGMTVALSYTDVATPDEWAAHSGRKTAEEFADELKRIQEENASELELLRKAYELKLSEQSHTLLQNTAEAIGDDPHRALFLAYHRGEVTAAELAQRLSDDARRKADLEMHRETRDWEDRRRVILERLDVYKELAKHGHLDEMGMEEIDRALDRVVGRLSGEESPEPSIEGRDLAALDEGDEPDMPDELREENSG